MTAKSADKQGIWSLKNVSKMYPHSKRHGFVFRSQNYTYTYYLSSYPLGHESKYYLMLK